MTQRRFPFPQMLAALALLVLSASPRSAVAQDGGAHLMPPGADDAVAALDASPRHGEWAMVRTAEGDSVRSWVVYPERSDAAPVVVVIHEIFGLTNWLRSVADQLAADGFVAIAPDLLTMQDVPVGENGDPERDPAVAAVRALDADAVHRQIRAVAEFAMALPAATDEYAIIGFCWGGSTSFEHATRFPDLGAAVVYYGGSPEETDIDRVRAPVLGLYGGDDARVNSTIPRAEAGIPGLYSANVYDGAGHGFLRQQDGRDGANLRASQLAWPRTVGFLHGALVARSRSDG